MKAKYLLTTAVVAGALFFSSFTERNKNFNYALDSETSVALWKGAGNNVEHTGSFSVSSQEILVEKGKLTGGSFTISIASIKNFDLPAEVKDVLLNHLKSPDFFNIAIHPEASFNITKVEKYKGKGDIEGANYLISGDFTMLGKTENISFPAKVELEGKKFVAEAKLQLDRTKWGMNYGADPSLGDHHIFPTVDIHLKLAGDQK